MVTLLLEKGADVNVQNKYGETALHHAAQEGHASVVAVLLEKGAAIDARNQDGLTALHKAALSDHASIVELLIEKGAAIDARTQEGGATALHVAAWEGHESVVALLLEQGARPVQSELLDEAFASFLTDKIVSGALDVELVKHIDALLKSGANPNVTFETGNRDRGAVDDMTPLRLSVVHGHTDLVRLLLQAGAEANTQDKDGMTALHLAADEGYTSIVALLLEKGVEVNTQAKDGRTALHLAAQKGRASIVALLLEKGVEVNTQAKDGATALHLAAQKGRASIVALLLEKGAAIDARNQDGLTALHKAALSDHASIVELLIEKGASPAQSEVMDSRFADLWQRVDWYSLSADTIDLAAVQQIQAYLKAGANPNITVDIAAPDGELTPLHLSAVIGRIDLVTMLLQLGGDATQQTARGYTPREMADRSEKKRARRARSSRLRSRVDYDAVKEALADYDSLTGRMSRDAALDMVAVVSGCVDRAYCHKIFS